jgi:hypothetical protein
MECVVGTGFRSDQDLALDEIGVAIEERLAPASPADESACKVVSTTLLETSPGLLAAVRIASACSAAFFDGVL